MSIWEEKISLPFAPFCTKEVSLSAVPGARARKINTSGFLRDCHAYYDLKIEDPGGCISRVSFHLNDMSLPVERIPEGGRWEITEWFTEDRVLPVHVLYHMTDYLAVTFDGGEYKDKEVRVTWKKVVYDTETADRLLKIVSEDQVPITYSNFRLIFHDGLAGYAGGDSRLIFTAPDKYRITNAGILSH